MSDDYGKTFNYILAESVKATDGQYTITMPNVNIGQVNVDFSTAVRKMNGGVIKVEEIDGPAFTLTVLNPNSDKGFTITGGVGIDEVETENGKVETEIYDLSGRRSNMFNKGIYIVNGKKVIM